MTYVPETQQAISDIYALKQAILRTKNKLPLTVDSVDTHLVMNSGSLAVATSIIVTEAVKPELVDDLIFLGANPEAHAVGLAFVAVTLVSLLGLAYGYLSYRARKGNSNLADYSDKYFAYFKNMSALSDIFVKFFVFALVLISNHPEWVAPLFVLFLGDLVFQGRLLILSPSVSMVMGVGCFITAIIMLQFGFVSIVMPAVIGAIVTAISLRNILKFRRQALTV